MRRLSKRAWRLLALVISLAVLASVTGLVFSLGGGFRAQPAAAPGTTKPATSPSPQAGSTQARADLSRMQALLNSGSVSRQAALLAPVIQFAPGSGPVVPPGKTITILPGTLRPDGQFGTVRARVSDGTTVTLGLYLTVGHWRLYAVQAGSAQTRAKVTGQPATARLLSDVLNPYPSPRDIGHKQPVILIHGWNGDPSSFGTPGTLGYQGSMRATIASMPGVWVSAFDWSATNGEWVTNPANGPAFTRYVNRVAWASKQGGGNGKVIIVAYSMGGLITRYSADAGAAWNIGMVVTIGTPNMGSLEANLMALIRRATCDNTPPAELSTDPGLAAYCTGQTAYSGMSMFGTQIGSLPELDPRIELHAIAGREVLGPAMPLWNARVNFASALGDFVVPERSALHQRPGGTQTVKTVTNNPYRLGDFSAAHWELAKNPQIIQLVRGYVSDYLQAHPEPPVTALGGADYWLANGGKWYVHDMSLQISRGPTGLVGMETWNAYGTIVNGYVDLAFTPQPDGSLLGTFTENPTYAPTGARDPSGFRADPDAPKKGEVIRLVPIAPMHAQTVFVSNPGPLYGNTNLCQLGLPDYSNYCGA